MAEVQEITALEGSEVAITGRLASMSREKARRALTDSGARYVPRPGPDTGFLIVGSYGPPLGEDGRLTASMRAARELQEAGRPLEILTEEEFLARLGEDGLSADLHRLYTVAQLARILELPIGRVRAWVRHGLIRPVKTVRRLDFFDFQQVAAARRLSRLSKAGISPGRLQKSLEQLERWMPDPGLAVELLGAFDGENPIVVRTNEGQLAEPSGQLRLEFEDGQAGTAQELDPGKRADGGPWFRRGVQAEDIDDLEAARQAYSRAVEDGETAPEIHFNLGNVTYALERFEEAARAYQRAVELDREYVEAWNNLGNALSALGRHTEAIESFGRALAIEPQYADPHFNLAETFIARGEIAPARRHWGAYLALDPFSDWAHEVRQRLERTEEWA